MIAAAAAANDADCSAASAEYGIAAGHHLVDAEGDVAADGHRSDDDGCSAADSAGCPAAAAPVAVLKAIVIRHC